jgi:hypothetical protein
MATKETIQSIAARAGRKPHEGLGLLVTTTEISVVNRGRKVAVARVWPNGQTSIEWCAGAAHWAR